MFYRPSGWLTHCGNHLIAAPGPRQLMTPMGQLTASPPRGPRGADFSVPADSLCTSPFQTSLTLALALSSALASLLWRLKNLAFRAWFLSCPGSGQSRGGSSAGAEMQVLTQNWPPGQWAARNEQGKRSPSGCAGGPPLGEPFAVLVGRALSKSPRSEDSTQTHSFRRGRQGHASPPFQIRTSHLPEQSHITRSQR